MSEALALGFSGGGDSTALLHALRAAFPDLTLHALIVDHQLRPESATEAADSADYARSLGAEPHILRWTAPRKNQAAARQARHRLLAGACEGLGVHLLCLGHTLDDRIETLRMRAKREGGWRTLTGMTRFDASPVWPEGRELTVARPFLELRRAELRDYLNRIEARWIEDSSNEDAQYERVQLRQKAYPPGGPAEHGLLSLSDQSVDAERLLRSAAWRLVERAVSWTPWGGARLNADMVSLAAKPMALRAMEAVMLAVSGEARTPSPDGVEACLKALEAREAHTQSGVLLTADGVMGRDPGAVLGRADGGAAPVVLELQAGEVGLFDGRFEVRAETACRVEALGERSPPDDVSLADVPQALRQSLTMMTIGARAEGDEIVHLPLGDTDNWSLLCMTRLRRWLLPCDAPAWFDGDKSALHIRSALAKTV
ncbi:tRNA lysidine(34) synthetase TilS [Oceanicaulis sp.]|uniref:tRNA lysidine(34) synthetase TilS n=1 Tax=Oceanicaulis sp. TaxID=1924941 RepID=UPI003BAA60DB